MCVIGWQAAMATTAFAATQQLQGLIALNIPSYVIKGWHSTLFCITITAFAILWNTVLVRKLPFIETLGLTLHVLGFFAFIIVLWVMGPRSDPKAVWTEFRDDSGWGSKGMATLVGILGPIVTLIGSDSTCHLSEELRDAAWVLPRAMVTAAAVNYALGFVMTVTVMSTLGSDLPALLTTSFGQPWIQILLNATESRAATSVMTAVMCALLLFCAINTNTTSSRQLFAFARDRGVPFSSFIAHVRNQPASAGNPLTSAQVHPSWAIPINALLITLLLTTLLSLIILGSTIAFNVITSLGQLGLVSSYIIVIACIFAKRLRREPLLPSRFSLGRGGIVVNALALCFLALAFVFLFFPAAPHPSPASMNWSCLMFGSILAFSLVYYWVRGRFEYVGPVEYVKVV